jgi:hypothetical protein
MGKGCPLHSTSIAGAGQPQTYDKASKDGAVSIAKGRQEHLSCWSCAGQGVGVAAGMCGRSGFVARRWKPWTSCAPCIDEQPFS